jgi:hypothetical protein
VRNKLNNLLSRCLHGACAYCGICSALPGSSLKKCREFWLLGRHRFWSRSSTIALSVLTGGRRKIAAILCSVNGLRCKVQRGRLHSSMALGVGVAPAGRSTHHPEALSLLDGVPENSFDLFLALCSGVGSSCSCPVRWNSCWGDRISSDAESQSRW